ncbi:hypothetical protein P5V15_001426 [Pogonomyrmex californicus]
MYVVKDDFPIAYEGILGIDFLKKYRAKCDHAKEILRIGSVNLKLHLHKKYILTPRSETIVQTITNQNQIGIVKPEETEPRVFIDSCLVEPDNYICPISIINTTTETIEITTPSVTLDAVQLGDAAEMLTLHESDGRTVQSRQECLHKLLRTEYLNHEEKKVLDML